MKLVEIIEKFLLQTTNQAPVSPLVINAKDHGTIDEGAQAPDLNPDQKIAEAFALARLWLNDIDMTERTKVFFQMPSPFNFFKELIDMPEKAEWRTWNRLYWRAYENFIGFNRERYEKVKRAHIDLFVKRPHYYRENRLLEIKKGE